MNQFNLSNHHKDCKPRIPNNCWHNFKPSKLGTCDQGDECDWVTIENNPGRWVSCSSECKLKKDNK